MHFNALVDLCISPSVPTIAYYLRRVAPCFDHIPRSAGAASQTVRPSPNMIRRQLVVVMDSFNSSRISYIPRNQFSRIISREDVFTLVCKVGILRRRRRRVCQGNDRWCLPRARARATVRSSNGHTLQIGGKCLNLTFISSYPVWMLDFMLQNDILQDLLV